MTIKVNRIPWGPGIPELLTRLDTSMRVTTIQLGIENETFTLFEVVFEGKRLGILLTRLDVTFDGEKELVVMFAVSEFKTSFPFSSLLGPVYEEIARSHGAKRIRTHSSRRGVDRLLEQNGYEFIESVFIKEVV